jgi:glyoxylase-like metal-dependent hydrolase (beta-lactamase superfamily II)
MPQPAESLRFERDFAPPYGVAEGLTPLITRVVCNNPGPFTFTGTASFIVGRKALAIIDPGPDDPEHLKALTSAIGDRHVAHILITHAHADHWALAPKLKALTGARVAAFRRVAAHSRGDKGQEALDARFDSNFAPDLALDEGDAIEGPDFRLEAVFTPGHTSDHMAYALAEERALFTGDHVMAWSTSVVAPPDGKMGSYLNSLEKLLRREDEVYWPTHGPPRREPLALVRGLIAHRRMREGAILARLKPGPKTVSALVAGIYEDIDPRLHAAAARTTLAHLEHLIEKRLVVAETAAGETLYRLS